MRSQVTLLFFLAALSGILLAAFPNAERGHLLYENHCGGCHEAHVHMRQGSKIHTMEEVRSEVFRWARELELGWTTEDTGDVTEYLYLKYYKDRSSDGL